ncbi:SIS domain-containing protein [Candidatus Pelagibacter sp.]|uniref:SIS domain-containing protein n=1 Tax=Candidatus Pelagibacter sp. TaxID=2024849 RepID=UPI003F869F79
MKKTKSFLKNYNNEFLNVATISLDIQKKIEKIFQLILKIKKDKKKIIISGNGGSAAIASHFSVDMTKNGKVRCINFNESDLITCFSNDYGYENWIKKAINFFSDSGDLIILISSSGNSKNIINAAKFAKSKKHKLITLSGFKGKNKLSKLGDINLIVNSNNYNLIENSHQYWLLSLVDMLNANI